MGQEPLFHPFVFHPRKGAVRLAPKRNLGKPLLQALPERRGVGEGNGQNPKTPPGGFQKPRDAFQDLQRCFIPSGPP